jgi:hypothetical protein
LAVILITFALFLAVLFTKGISHDLFLESGVFLVSVKLIILGLKNGLQAKRMENELREIKGLLQRP